MKQILLALLLAFCTSSLVNAQKQTTDTADNTAVEVTSLNKADTNSAEDGNMNNVSSRHSGKSSGFSIINEDNFPFTTFGDAVSGGILVSIISIIAFFGFPVFILFVIFFFRYKNRKARYRLAEQVLAAGQPLPENFIREKRPTDQRSQGIKNIFTGIGLFIFLWSITGKLGIATIGLLVMFTGIGQWIIGNKEYKAGNTNGEDSNDGK